MLQVADSADFEFRLLRATIETNTRQRQRIVDKIGQAITGSRTGSLSRRRIGLLGLTFKAGTDDLRASPALDVAALLRQAGADLVGYDPAVSAGARNPALAGVTVVDDPAVLAKDADALVILTEWPQFRTLDWAQLATLTRTALIVDTRNLLDPDVVTRAGFTCHQLGAAPRRPR
jgi:UDPglucose 6-dehydrogenase